MCFVKSFRYVSNISKLIILAPSGDVGLVGAGVRVGLVGAGAVRVGLVGAGVGVGLVGAGAVRVGWWELE